MRKLSVLAVAALCAAQPVFATGGIYCDGALDSSVGAYLTVGSAPGFPVVGARIATADRAWSMIAEDDAEQIEFVQGAITGAFIVADFADENVENIVVSLRLVRVENDTGVASAGVLSLPGVGAWPVVCEID
ncbi:MAG: hypothetical protein AAGK37_22865 [Pseudomonadota bacterium]